MPLTMARIDNNLYLKPELELDLNIAFVSKRTIFRPRRGFEITEQPPQTHNLQFRNYIRDNCALWTISNSREYFTPLTRDVGTPFANPMFWRNLFCSNAPLQFRTEMTNVNATMKGVIYCPDKYPIHRKCSYNTYRIDFWLPKQNRPVRLNISFKHLFLRCIIPYIDWVD